MTPIELHKRAIELLQTINLYKKLIRVEESFLEKLIEPFNVSSEHSKHKIDIYKRVVTRLLSRYNNTMFELNKQLAVFSLPSKDEVVADSARVYNGEYKKRNVMRNNMQDCYYSGYLDCLDKLAGNER